MAQALAVRMSLAAQATVFRNNNGTFTALGAAFTPSGGMLTDDQSLDKKNLAVQFANDFYCIVGDDVRKYNPSTQVWDAEVTPGGFAFGSIFEHTGIYVGRGPTGAPRAFILFKEVANSLRALFLDAGGSWTLGASGPTEQAVGDSGFGACHAVFRGQLHISAGRDIYIYDPASDSITVQNIGGGGANGGNATFCRARGAMWMARTDAVGGANQFTNLYQFVGGLYVLVIDGSASTPTLPRQDPGGNPGAAASWLCMHYDTASDRIILHAYEDLGSPTTRGWKTLALDPGGGTEVTDLTGTVTPAALAYNTGPDMVDIDIHWSVQVDNETNPAAQVVTIWILLSVGTYEAFRWNGAGSVMTSLGTGGDRGIALSNMQTGGGEYIYEGSDTANPALHIEEVLTRQPIPGGTRIFLRGYTFDESGGAPTAAVEDVGLYFGILQEAPTLLATISAVAKVSGAGAVPGLLANKMTGATMDGSTIYSMDWTAVDSAEVANGQFHQLMPRIEI